MVDPEYDQPGPMTARTIREIEDYWHSKIGPVPVETPAPTPPDDELADLIALRNRWSEVPDDQH